MNNPIELSKKSRGIANWFTEEWVTNGFFAVKRYLIGNSDEHLMALGFEYRDMFGRAFLTYDKSKG